MMTAEKDHGIRLSMIIPCYNAERYLPACLDALLGQPLKEMELICVNDGSSDGTLRILQEYRRRYGSRIVIIDKKNEGEAKARRDGIRAASGEYIGFSDADDHVCGDFAVKMYETAVRSGADVVCCGFARTDMETGRVLSEEMTRFPYKSFDIRKEPGLLLGVNPAAWNKIYRAEILKELPDLEQEPRVMSDMILSQLIWLRARRIVFVPEALVCYRVRRDSLLNSGARRDIPTVCAAMRRIRQIYEESAPDMLDYLDAEAFLHLGVSLMHRTADGPGKYTVLRKIMRLLDRGFPRWRKNPYIRFSYAASHRGANLKLIIVRWFVRLHLFGLFLSVYRFMIRHLGKDIKW